MRALEELRGRPITVLDVGCSYGNNGILLRMPLDFHRLAQRYADLTDSELTAAELAQLDRHYFKGWPRHEVTVIGLDSAAPAVEYAKSVGAIDHGIVADLEAGELTADQKRLLAKVDLVISTGCIGYVTERTFAKILDAVEGPKPWVASFVLRMYPFAPIAGELARRGIATEKLDGVTFVQRRFNSADECQRVLASLEAQGIATEGKESDGLYHAEFFLSRPPREADIIPLADIATVGMGEMHHFGRRYRRDSDRVLRLMR